MALQVRTPGSWRPARLCGLGLVGAGTPGLGPAQKSPFPDPAPNGASGYRGGCVEPGVTAGSSIHLAASAICAGRHYGFLHAARMGAAARWSPADRGLIHSRPRLPVRRGIELGTRHFSQSCVHPAASAAREFPGPEGLENRPLPFPTDRLPAYPAPGRGCIFQPWHAPGRGGRRAVESFSHPASLQAFRNSSFSPGDIRRGAVCPEREAFFSCRVPLG